MIPKIGQILRRVTPAQELPNVIIAEAVEEAMVVAVVHQGGMWTAQLGNGASYRSHDDVEHYGLYRLLVLPRLVSAHPSSCVTMTAPRDSWPPDGWELVE